MKRNSRANLVISDNEQQENSKRQSSDKDSLEDSFFYNCVQNTQREELLLNSSLYKSDASTANLQPENLISSVDNMYHESSFNTQQTFLKNVGERCDLTSPECIVKVPLEKYDPSQHINIDTSHQNSSAMFTLDYSPQYDPSSNIANESIDSSNQENNEFSTPELPTISHNQRQFTSSSNLNMSSHYINEQLLITNRNMSPPNCNADLSNYSKDATSYYVPNSLVSSNISADSLVDAHLCSSSPVYSNMSPPHKRSAPSFLSPGCDSNNSCDDSSMSSSSSNSSHTPPIMSNATHSKDCQHLCPINVYQNMVPSATRSTQSHTTNEELRHKEVQDNMHGIIQATYSQNQFCKLPTQTIDSSSKNNSRNTLKEYSSSATRTSPSGVSLPYSCPDRSELLQENAEKGSNERLTNTITSASDDSIDVLEPETDRIGPEVITLLDDSDVELETRVESTHTVQQGSIDSSPGIRIVRKETPRLNEQLLSLQSKFQHRSRRNLDAQGSSSRSSHKRSRKHFKAPSHSKKKRKYSAKGREASRIIEHMETKPAPGSIGELLLMNHTKRFVEKVITVPKPDTNLTSGSGADVSSNNSSCYNTDEDELMLRKAALQSVFQVLDKDHSNPTPAAPLANTVDTVNPISEPAHFDYDANTSDVLLLETNKDPVDMEICDSDPEDHALTNDELREVGDNFTIPVEWAYMLPPPSSRHANDIINFKNFSLEQNLCKQVMESSYLATSPQEQTSSHIANDVVAFSDYQDPATSQVLFPSSSSPAARFLYPENVDSVEKQETQSQQQYVETANNSVSSQEAIYHETQALSQFNAGNQEAFMDAISKQRKYKNNNLIQIKLNKKNIHTPPKKQKKQKNVLRKAKCKTNMLSASKQSVAVDTLTDKASNEVSLDSKKVAKNTEADDEDEHSLRTLLLMSMLTKPVTTEVFQPRVLSPTPNSTVDASLQIRSTHAAAITASTASTETSQSSLSQVTNSSQASSTRDTSYAQVNAHDLPLNKAGQIAFRYPKPIIINLNDESDSEDDELPFGNSNSSAATTQGNSDHVIANLCDNFLKDMRRGTDAGHVLKSPESNTPKVRGPWLPLRYVGRGYP